MSSDEKPPRPACKYDWIDLVAEQTWLRPAVRLTLIAMAKGADSTTGRSAHPGREGLAARLGISVSSVDRHLKKGVESGLLIRTFSASKAGRKDLADEYRLTVPAAMAKDPAVDWRGWTSRHIDDEWSAGNQSSSEDRTSRQNARTSRQNARTSRHIDDDPTSSLQPALATGSVTTSAAASSTSRAEQSAQTETSTVVELATWAAAERDEDRDADEVVVSPPEEFSASSGHGQQEQPTEGGAMEQGEQLVATVPGVLAASGVKPRDVRAFVEATNRGESIISAGAVLAKRITTHGPESVVMALTEWRERRDAEEAEQRRREAERAAKAAWNAAYDRAGGVLTFEQFTPFLRRLGDRFSIHDDCEGEDLNASLLDAYVDAIDGGLTPEEIALRAWVLPDEGDPPCLPCWLRAQSATKADAEYEAEATARQAREGSA